MAPFVLITFHRDADLQSMLLYHSYSAEGLVPSTAISASGCGHRNHQMGTSGVAAVTLSFMNADIQFLVHLQRTGYFDRKDFDPQTVLQVCRRLCSIDTSTVEGNDQLGALINGLVDQGLITFQYTKDPNLHPKDRLDYWRIELTSTGISTLDQIRKSGAVE